MSITAKRTRKAGAYSREQLRSKLDDFQKADVIIDLGGGSLVGAGPKMSIEESDKALDVMRDLVESQVEDYDKAHPDVA